MDRTQAPGRRERKKAATRQALATAARRLFLERGFDQVTVAEIADAADTAVSTLFAHFPGGKEALVLGDGAEREHALTTAVRDRPAGVSILRALHDFLATRGPFDPAPDPKSRAIADLVVSTPALRAYARTLWTSCETTLAHVIAEQTGQDPGDLSLRLFARYVLEIPDIAGTEPDPPAALAVAFTHLQRGWPDL
ncbi:DNA-binding transcriptional regulator, AcrR family [Amycolatopsis xylanica]|uniref:DNA-binding transcriptional regulator, AcrR family n=1 Tax=Amycolatopsis xylanica TaxID=589385 RepID=A0A1H2SI97_9PSEU|nr:TetR/AcrR family transcriptional regulator [Amycolatopsis xylanica]SDW31423.1 DNA-binding transcriptional regulator, AcrR family [Amycolatopsis xylanica]